MRVKGVNSRAFSGANSETGDPGTQDDGPMGRWVGAAAPQPLFSFGGCIVKRCEV